MLLYAESATYLKKQRGDIGYESYPRVGARRSSPIFPVRHSLIQLGPERLCFPGRGKTDLQLAQGGTAIRAQFQEVGQAPERVHDGVKRIGGAELVEELCGRVAAGVL